MIEELYEARGNLDKIESSLLLVNSDIKKMKGLSPNSHVEIDTLKGKPEEHKHTWANVVNNILTDKSIAFIVVRSNKRQLMLMSRDQDYVNSSDKCLIIWSNYALSIPAINEVADGNEYIVTASLNNAQSKMCKTVVAYVDHIKGKKNWDIIKVYKDETLGVLKQDREESRKGMEIKPNGTFMTNARIKHGSVKDKQQRDYRNYIDSLHDNLKERLKAFIEKRLVNVNSKEDLQQNLKDNNTLAPKKIKIAGLIYNYDGISSTNLDPKRNLTIGLQYDISDGRGLQNPNIRYLMIKLLIQGVNNASIGEMFFKPAEYSNSGWISFEEGVQYIKDNLNKNNK